MIIFCAITQILLIGASTIPHNSEPFRGVSMHSHFDEGHMFIFWEDI